MSIEPTRREEFAVVTSSRIEALNALNYEMLRAIARTLDEVEASDARAVFFTGAGEKAFCAGAYIGEPTVATREDYRDSFHGMLHTVDP
jgi:enoyl-CoA hydratase